MTPNHGRRIARRRQMIDGLRSAAAEAEAEAQRLRGQADRLERSTDELERDVR